MMKIYQQNEDESTELINKHESNDEVIELDNEMKTPDKEMKTSDNEMKTPIMR